MFRAGLILLRRLIFAASLLILLVCGAEVGVRIYEAITGAPICRSADATCSDPSKLAVPSWSFHHELKPLAKAKVECRDTKSHVEFQTNSLGLRGPEPAIPKPADICRIVVLGDETIFAPETSDSDHFCSLLQNLLQQQTRMRIEVVNAGIPGHCPLTEFVLFKQRLLSLQPDLVLLHFDWSDVADDRQIRRLSHCDEAGIPQSCPNAKLIASKKSPPLHEVWRQQFRLLDWGMNCMCTEWKQQVARQKAVSRDVDTNPYAWLRDEHPEENVAFRHALRPLLDFAKLCQSSHCQFVIMTSPKPWQVSAKCSRGEGVRLAAGVAREAYFSSRAPFNVLANFAADNNIPLIDGSAVIVAGQGGEQSFLRHAPRWSPPGHSRMSEYVTNFLIEKVPGAWNSPYFQQNDQPVTRTMPRDNPIQWTAGQQSNSDHAVPNIERQLR